MKRERAGGVCAGRVGTEMSIRDRPEGATPISTPVGESPSNGGIESVVRLVKDMLRVHLAALERKISVKFPSEHPVLTWLEEHVTDINTKYLPLIHIRRCRRPPPCTSR